MLILLQRHSGNVTKRDDSVRELVREYELPGFKSLSTDLSQGHLERFNRLIKDKETEIADTSNTEKVCFIIFSGSLSIAEICAKFNVITHVPLTIFTSLVGRIAANIACVVHTLCVDISWLEMMVLQLSRFCNLLLQSCDIILPIISQLLTF